MTADSPSLHPLLAARHSPTRFDPQHEVGVEEVAVLLEAARWAPSAGNSQPWAFVVGRRGSAVHARLVRHLALSSASWAPSASLLVANLAHRYVESTDWDYSEFALYDLGQAVAHMTVQAQALGLQARQFRAFDRAGLTTEFDVPAHWEVTTMAAFGRTTEAAPMRDRRARVVWPVEDAAVVSSAPWAL
ncbi:MAG TPA: nitroreductase family protein [Pseudonocardia sp.]